MLAQQKLAINDALAAQKIRNSTAEKRAKRPNANTKDT
jgi:hypothetical protein